MKKILFGKCWLILISTCVTGTGIVLACAGDWGAEYGKSSFAPEVFVDSVYSPFFFSSNFYYNIGHDEEHDSRFNTSNVDDWSGYFNKSVPAGELEYMLLNAATSSIDSAHAWLSGKAASLPVAMQSFELFRYKGDKKMAAFLHYLLPAKKAEAFALNKGDYGWNYGEKKEKSVHTGFGSLGQELKAGFSANNDPFLKERYWFQLERFYFFSGSPDDALNLFNTHEKKFSPNKMYYRTMAYAAGAYYKKKAYSKANYFYSRVYDGCNELKTVAHFSFHPQEDSDWQATLALCRNKNERATLWQMLGVFYSDEQRAMREIYNLDPKSEKLDLLLARLLIFPNNVLITNC